MERGSHRELMEKNGVFAAMWADQIRAEAPQLIDFESKPEAEGYSVEPTIKDAAAAQAEQPNPDFEPVPEPVADEEVGKEGSVSGKGAPSARRAPSTAETKEPSTRASFAAVAASEPAEDSAVVKDSAEGATSSEAPVAFPTGPVSFPTSDEPDELEEGQVERQAASPAPAGVTFDDSVRGSREATPDPSDPKRKRTASQNFQRFTRRVSLVGRRVVEPGWTGSGKDTKDDKRGRDTKDDVHANEPGETGSARGEGESPAASVQEGKKPMREKLKKRLSLGRPSA